MKTKTRKVLPKMVGEIQNGGVYSQRVRCGKSNCKCARGESHTAYYFFTRCRGKPVKFYVRKAEVKAFTEIAKLAALNRAQKRLSVKESNKLFRRLQEVIRDSETLKKSYQENYKNERS
jgi:hypothetical protein